MFLMSRFARPLAASVKESTGITGLPVVLNAKEVLIGLYKTTLDMVQTIPESAQYRKTVEDISRHRLKLVEESEDWTQIEAKIGGGQVEQIIQQAKDELLLIPRMAEWKPWETAEGSGIQLILEENDTPSHVPIHRSNA